MSDETAVAEPAADVPPPKGKKGIVLIGALAGGLLAGAGAGLFAIGPVVARTSGYDVTDSMRTQLKAQAVLVYGAVAADSIIAAHAAEGQHADSSADGVEGGEHAAGGGEGAGPTANLHLVDNLVMNPAGSGGTRFLMLSAAIEFSDAALVEQFKARDAEVRDLVLRVVGSKSVEDLADMRRRDSLRLEMADSLATLVPKAGRRKAIARIFFPQFVIQ